MTPCLRVDEVETLPTFSLPFSISSLRNPDPEHEPEREHERDDPKVETYTAHDTATGTAAKMRIVDEYGSFGRTTLNPTDGQAWRGGASPVGVSHTLHHYRKHTLTFELSRLTRRLEFRTTFRKESASTTLA